MPSFSSVSKVSRTGLPKFGVPARVISCRADRSESSSPEPHSRHGGSMCTNNEAVLRGYREVLSEYFAVLPLGRDEGQRKQFRPPIPFKTKEKHKVPRASVYTKVLEK
eukprot:30476-Amphidinium_carterae.1